MTNSYVQEKNIGSLFEFLMSNVLRDKPASPAKYLIALLQERGEALLEDPIPCPVTDPIHCEGHAMELRRSFDRNLPRSFPATPLPDLGPSPTPSDFDLQLDLEAKERELALSPDPWFAIVTESDIELHRSESSIGGKQSPTTLVGLENDPEPKAEAELTIEVERVPETEAEVVTETKAEPELIIYEAELINEDEPENIPEQESSARSQNATQSNEVLNETEESLKEDPTTPVPSEHEPDPQNDCEALSEHESQNERGAAEADMDEELHSSKASSIKEHDVEPPYTMSVRSCDVSIRSWYEGELYADSCACSIRSGMKEQVSSTLQSAPPPPPKRWTPPLDSDDSGTELYEDDELAEEGLQRSPSSNKGSVKGRNKMMPVQSQPMKSCRTIFLNPIQDEPTISPEPSPRVVARPDDPFTPRGGWTPLDTQRSDTCSVRRDMSLARILGDDAASLFSEGDLAGEEWAYAESVS